MTCNYLQQIAGINTKTQKAMARAVYSRKQVIIMDDAMKGLDADTASKCFEALFGQRGVLRQSNITVIMAAHNGNTPPECIYKVYILLRRRSADILF